MFLPRTNGPRGETYLNGMKIRWGYASIGLLVLLVAGKYVANTYFGPSDETLIKKALDDALVASREGRPGGVLDFLGDSFKVNSTAIGGRQVSDFIRNQKPDIQIDYRRPQFGVDTARMSSSARIKISIIGFDQDVTLKDITLDFKKEDSTDFLLLPVKKWRLTAIHVPQNSLPEEAQPYAQ